MMGQAGFQKRDFAGADSGALKFRFSLIKERAGFLVPAQQGQASGQIVRIASDCRGIVHQPGAIQCFPVIGNGFFK